MIQIYFLSIFFFLFTGYTLISEDEKEAIEIRPGLSLKDEKVRLILGFLCMICGVLKLLSPIGDIYILGDLVPAAVGFIAGLILVIQNYRSRSGIAEPKETSFSKILLLNRKIIGFIAIAVAAVHFLLPGVLFL
jgi:uncharacterized membrane protein HdeD (DUF308 family)